MIATRLRLELLLQEISIDLRAVAEVILSDPGATLQIFRLIGEEFPSREDRPTRIEDCIASLSTERWYEAVSLASVPHDGHVLGQWQHFRLVAQYSRELAGEAEGFSPEEAYLIGLLHQLGTFPSLLGWDHLGVSMLEQKALGVMLADHFHLPAFLVAAMTDEQGGARSRWGAILQTAQQAAQQAQRARTE